MSHRTVRLLVVAVIAPVVIALTGALIQLLWVPQLPAAVAVHRSLSGVDGTGPAWSVIVLTLALGIALPVLFGILAITAARRSGVTWVIRLLGALSPAVGVLLTVLLTWSLGLQGGLADAYDAPPIGPVVIISALIGVATGLLAWFALPKHQRRETAGEQPASMELAPGEKAVWIGLARPTPGPLAGVAAAVLLVAAAGVLGTVVSDGRGWPILFAPVVLAVVVADTLSWKVRVDDQGLVVRGLFGWPVFRVARDQLEGATTRDIAAIGDFGGWGIRFGPSHALGIITRSGEALVAHRMGDRELVVTVDDAGSAASLLAAYTPAERA